MTNADQDKRQEIAAQELLRDIDMWQGAQQRLRRMGGEQGVIVVTVPQQLFDNISDRYCLPAEWTISRNVGAVMERFGTLMDAQGNWQIRIYL